MRLALRTGENSEDVHDIEHLLLKGEAGTEQFKNKKMYSLSIVRSVL